MLRVWRGAGDEVDVPAKLLVGGEWFADFAAAALV
jgi:hypothetical protein